VPSFLLTIDVEDWFQVENLRPWMPLSTWDSRELRVEANVHKLLDLFDNAKFNAPNPECINPENPVNPVGEFSGSASRSNPTNSTNPIDSTDSTPPPTSNLQPPAVKKVRCTFFTLGWIAKRLPHLVREIVGRGHEVASHGSSHRMCNSLSDADLRSELADSKHLLEDITGTPVSGFRAPNFSVDDRVLSILQEAGYRYDSSYNDFSLHGRYGKISLNGQRAGIAYKLSSDFFELPISNLPLFAFPILGNLGILAHYRHFVIPFGGGAYFRLMPLSMFTLGVRSIIEKEDAYIFYMHPWEIDPGQPRVEQASLFTRFKHYKNIATTGAKLKMLIESFTDCRFVACRDYVNDGARLTEKSLLSPLGSLGLTAYTLHREP
jgi:polysaccharide deacetylase family protein (PEP-CTERM system associated)